MKVNVGIIGFGVIGSGVAKLILTHGGLITKRTGVELNILKIADLDIESDRGIDIDKSCLTTNMNDVLENEDIDIVVELVGGTTISFDIVKKALENKKHVVTANKALLYEHGSKLFEIAVQNEREIRFEASVGGGIPIIRVITESLAGDKVSEIYGIVNGTTNFILTKMINEQWQFDYALKQAQELGFAEADPTLDIDGSDAAHKIAVLARVAFGAEVKKENVLKEGIEGINLQDVLYAKELGYVIKLLAIAKRSGESMEIRVHPALLPEDCNMASVSNEFNAVMLNSDFLGFSHYVGKGAGAEPTASAVVGDLADLGVFIKYKREYVASRFEAFNKYETLESGKILSRYYLRLTTIDKAGILAKILKILGDNKVSISSIIQKEVPEEETEPVSVIILTHSCTERDIQNAVSIINDLDTTKKDTVLLRVEDMEM